MTITSVTFLIFLLSVIVLSYLIPGKFRWLVLLVASLGFYMQGGLSSLSALLFTALTTWMSGKWLGKLDKIKKKGLRRFIVFVCLVLNFGLLFIIKYAPQSGLILPMGLSFYMFQAAGYVIDCYRKKYEPQTSFARFLLFISYFPQVIQGPISRYNELAPQLFSDKKYSSDEMAENLRNGIYLMLWGLFKKLLIANRLSLLVSSVFDNYEGHGGALYLVAAALSVVQLYMDFSGGIDIVSGASECLGIKLALNFKRPLFSVSLADYWQRWHITLYTWLRDYLFYPVAFSKPFIKLGSWCRKNFTASAAKAIPTTIASFVVYFVIGIWHGAGAGYFAFALFNAVLITVSNVFPVLLKTPKWFSMIRTWILVVISEFMIRADNLRLGMRMLSNVFTNFQGHELFGNTFVSLGLSVMDIWVIVIGLIAVTALEAVQERNIKIRASLAKQSIGVQWLMIALPLFAVVIFGYALGSAVDAAFIYGAF